MSEPVRGRMVAFEDLRYSDDCAPQYRDKIALTFVVTPDDARRFRLSTEWSFEEVPPASSPEHVEDEGRR